MFRDLGEKPQSSITLSGFPSTFSQTGFVDVYGSEQQLHQSNPNWFFRESFEAKKTVLPLPILLLFQTHLPRH